MLKIILLRCATGPPGGQVQWHSARKCRGEALREGEGENLWKGNIPVLDSMAFSKYWEDSDFPSPAFLFHYWHILVNFIWRQTAWTLAGIHNHGSLLSLTDCSLLPSKRLKACLRLCPQRVHSAGHLDSRVYILTSIALLFVHAPPPLLYWVSDSVSRKGQAERLSKWLATEDCG